jgi:hypothetical protein
MMKAKEVLRMAAAAVCAALLVAALGHWVLLPWLTD